MDAKTEKETGSCATNWPDWQETYKRGRPASGNPRVNYWP